MSTVVSGASQHTPSLSLSLGMHIKMMEGRHSLSALLIFIPVENKIDSETNTITLESNSISNNNQRERERGRVTMATNLLV